MRTGGGRTSASSSDQLISDKHSYHPSQRCQNCHYRHGKRNGFLEQFRKILFFTRSPNIFKRAKMFISEVVKVYGQPYNAFRRLADVPDQCPNPPRRVWCQFLNPRGMNGTSSVSNHRLIVRSQQDLLPTALHPPS
ncbi:hypothetical protein RB195_009037 [Necator americanus]|uniref:Uncharacterized protein n=1 Tax=Necator americanus TaxID=51031 RepID=A0ABR1CRH2_NECAM